jgi:hypothetical protein
VVVVLRPLAVIAGTLVTFGYAAYSYGKVAAARKARAAADSARDFPPDGSKARVPGVATRPVLVDDQTVRLPSGHDVRIGPGLTEFRDDEHGVATRFRREGRDVEYGWRADPSAPSPQAAVWGSAWSVHTEPGVRVGVEEGGTVLSLPNGRAVLPLPLGTLIQDHEKFFVSLQTGPSDTKNVACYDDRGVRLWEIGDVPATQRAGGWAAIDVAPDGTLTAMNSFPFTATVDKETGAILSIREGPW